MTPATREPKEAEDILRIAVTVGEPAGIGPDIILALAQYNWDAELVVIGDPAVLLERAQKLNIKVSVRAYDQTAKPAASRSGALCVAPVKLATSCKAGVTDVANARSVLQTLELACDGCMSGEFAAMVTAPVQKSTINAAGIPFSGHTEYLAERCGGQLPVMMLANNDTSLRVALVTTHLPLRAVAEAITADALSEVCKIVAIDVERYFGIVNPRLAILGLNPHAGEAGHLGSEEKTIMQPVINQLRATGLNLTDPLPADTAFTTKHLQDYDAVIAMYHDQGLPVVKHAGFGNVVNITLGLPIIRTSVDHGTALELAGSGLAKADSLMVAVRTAIAISRKMQQSA
jgi:4-hydroxythreonine-4-phosphate dehydrogenase